MRRKFIELWRRELVKRDGMMEMDGADSEERLQGVRHLEGFVDR